MPEQQQGRPESEALAMGDVESMNAEQLAQLSMAISTDLLRGTLTAAEGDALSRAAAKRLKAIQRQRD
jgi:hypothetical protein